MWGILVLLLATPSFQEESPVSIPERLLQKLREQSARSVVAIEVDRTSDPQGRTGSGSHGSHNDYYNRPVGPTSGTVIAADGYILTTWFNVSGKIQTIKVTGWDGKSSEATLVGYDQIHDIALLQIERTDLPLLPTASRYRQGDFVFVVGRSPSPLRPTVNVGIISATDRWKKSAVQTDAELNYGNVGGPLITLQGELVGVTCHIRPREPWGQSSGVGFATKWETIQKLLPRLKAGEKILQKERAFLGIQPGEGEPDIVGIQVGQVLPGSPAEQAKILPGDIITSIDKEKVETWEDFLSILEKRKPGKAVQVKVERKIEGVWKTQTFEVRLGALPRGN
ncbi:MAG: trypsin-like peptidase domain-containing protein [Planctomycetota bacterium]|jgi:serine protease DegS|nr:trypsin-like peptidase domain-containing protein [Planctomycetota bacterium]